MSSSSDQVTVAERHSLLTVCNEAQSEGAQRDILLLDIALDSYFRTCIERTDRSSLQGDDIVELVTLVLKNAIIASENEDLVQVAALLNLEICTICP